MPCLVLDRLEIVTTPLDVQARVTLGFGEARHEGSADAGASRGGLARAVAQACVRAAGGTLGARRRLELEQVEQVHLAGRAVVVVLITLLGPRGLRVLTGAAPVEEDLGAATAAAVLSALGSGGGAGAVSCGGAGAVS